MAKLKANIFALARKGDEAMVIKPSKYHRIVDGTELVEARGRLFITQAVFASKCDWSPQYQAQLEAPGEHEIPATNAEKILQVLYPAQTT